MSTGNMHAETAKVEQPWGFSRAEDLPPGDVVERFKQDSLSHRILNKANEAIDVAMKAVSRGPDPDFEGPNYIVERQIIEKQGGTPSSGAILNALIIAAIVALVGAVWTLSMSVTTLQAQYVSQQKQIDALAARK